VIKPMLAIKVTRFLIKSLFRGKVKRPPVGLLDVQGQCCSLSVESQCFLWVSGRLSFQRLPRTQRVSLFSPVGVQLRESISTFFTRSSAACS